MELLTHLIFSVLFGCSMSILLVEKGEDWPVNLITKPIKYLFSKIYNKLPQLLECTVCATFWTTLIGELCLKFWITKLFLWPFTGVIALGVTWVIIEFLNALDNSRNQKNSPD